jgi:myosin-5
MGLKTSTLEHALRHRYIHTAGEQLEALHTPASAKDSLDTLVRTIYNDIFDEILNSVNAKTKGQSLQENSDGMIQILDLFGFETFEVNRFEQLCINYTNEMLHKKYIDDNFKRFKKEFDREGIDLFDYSQVDNVDVLDLLEGKDGIINMLSEECLIPNGSDQVSSFNDLG